MARPRVQIDLELVGRMAAYACTVEEMAAMLGCNKRTLERRFMEAILKGRAKGEGIEIESNLRDVDGFA